VFGGRPKSLLGAVNNLEQKNLEFGVKLLVEERYCSLFYSYQADFGVNTGKYSKGNRCLFF
jgi:hypothetical protein